MNARSIRRAAERKAAKLARKQAKHADAVQPSKSLPATLDLLAEESDALQEMKKISTKRHVGRYRRQAASESARAPGRCTGPVTAEGKAISSLNGPSAQGVSLPVVRVQEKHGLTGVFRVLASESQKLFDELRDALRREHAPSTATETLLVDRMAEHVWLSQRAQRFQDDALFDSSGQSFALYLRYQTTNDRAFHKCLRELATLRRERQQFESQNEEAILDQAVPVELRSLASERPVERHGLETLGRTSSNRKMAISLASQQASGVCSSRFSAGVTGMDG